MKKYIFSTLALVLLLTGSVFANEEVVFVERAKANYLQGMDNNISPVVETAIFNVMALKQQFPDYNYDAVIKKLAKLSSRSEVPEVRQKAYLALNYFKNTEWFGDYQFVGQTDTSLVFSDMTRKLDIRSKISFINGR